MRIYDPRLGKFLSMDPLTSNFAMLTPYQFASNSPILGIDLDGLEFANPWLVLRRKMPVLTGFVEGLSNSYNKTVDFFKPNGGNAYKAETWKQAGLFIEELALGSSSNTNIYNPSTPRLDAAVESLNTNVIHGDSYTRSKFLGEFTGDMATGYAISKFVKTLGSFVQNVREIIPTIHIDIGGYGRYKGAFNYTTSRVDYSGNPIPNLVQGFAEKNLKSVAANSVDMITIENAPFHDEMLSQATRVLKSNGSLSITTSVPGVNFSEIAKKFKLTLSSTKSVQIPDAYGTGTPLTETTATFIKP